MIQCKLCYNGPMIILPTWFYSFHMKWNYASASATGRSRPRGATRGTARGRTSLLGFHAWMWCLPLEMSKLTTSCYFCFICHADVYVGMSYANIGMWSRCVNVISTCYYIIAFVYGFTIKYKLRGNEICMSIFWHKCCQILQKI